MENRNIKEDTEDEFWGFPQKKKLTIPTFFLIRELKVIVDRCSGSI